MLMEWMLMPLRRYADFDGRSRRKEYWMFVLFNAIILGIAMALLWPSLVAHHVEMTEAGVVTSTAATSRMGALPMIIIAGIALYSLAILIPAIAVQVRRFHDQDKSGWFVLLNFIPYIGSLIVLVFMCLEGTRGENRYGPDPKAGEA